MNVGDEENGVPQTPQILSSSLERQIPVSGDKVAHFGATPSTDNPKTRALLRVQGKTNKKPFLKRKVAYKLICHYKCITNAITISSHMW